MMRFLGPVWAFLFGSLLPREVYDVRGASERKPLDWRVNVVYKNPGEGPTITKYSDPSIIRELGYNVMVKAEGRPPHTAITWDSFDPEIFPENSQGRQWVEDLADQIDQDIRQMHDAGLTALYWFDMFVLPLTLVEKYNASIVDKEGQWSFDSPLMADITRYLLDQVFLRFPDLDGLLIRTGEIYTQDVPYHVGASPITQGYSSHIELLRILDEVVVQKHDKLLLYRTWSFDGFTKDPSYYLNVTDAIEPHPNIFFVIKHVAADFWRTVPFNPTINIGKHNFLVEIQCQREYESKGAVPNYIMNGVIDGFEEYGNDTGYRGLKEITSSTLFKGIVTWARGGGWRGPYPSDEFWIDMNVKVIAEWAQNPFISEETIFTKIYEDHSAETQCALRKIALLSARGVLLGHYSLIHQLQRLEWTRDFYIGGTDHQLATDAEAIIFAGQVDAVLEEKQAALKVWKQIKHWSEKIDIEDDQLRSFIDDSICYAQLYYELIANSWTVGLLGLQGNSTDSFETERIKLAIEDYDRASIQYYDLSRRNLSGVVSSLYVPFEFKNTTSPDPVLGANNSVNIWRWVIL